MNRTPRPRWRRLERGAVLLLLLAAAVPRSRDLFAGFDREMEGFQGSCFAGFAVNYERLGVGRFGGYPTFNILLPSNPERTPYLYPNHPPLVPLLAWASIKAFGPEGWSEAWRRGEPPEGIEGPIRLPFFAFHLIGLFALWWAVRQSGSARLAMLTLAVASFLPVSIVYATLVNYESPYLAFLLFACGFHVRWLRGGRPRDLAAGAALFCAGSAVTFAPVFFLPPLIAQTLLRRGPRRAGLQALAFGGAALIPLALHGLWVKAVVPELYSQGVWDRARNLTRPLFDGSAPFTSWCARQALRLEHFFSGPLFHAAWIGLALLGWRASRGLWRRWRPAGSEGELAPSLGLPLFLGGASILLGFYAHTWDGDGVYNGQTLFLLNLAPAGALLAAHLLDALAGPLYRLRGGVAPLVVLVSLIGLPALLRTDEIRYRWRAPGPADDPRLESGPADPLPETAGRRIAEILPADAIGLFPQGMGFTAAVRFYAWRQLLPVNRGKAWEIALTRIDVALGLADAPRYMLIPRDPPEAIRTLVEEVRADLDQRYDVLATTEYWELWPSFD